MNGARWSRRAFLDRVAQAGAAAGMVAVVVGVGAARAKAVRPEPGYAFRPLWQPRANWIKGGGNYVAVSGNDFGMRGSGRVQEMAGGGLLVNDGGRIFEVINPVLSFGGRRNATFYFIKRGRTGCLTDHGVVRGIVNGQRYFRRLDDLRGYYVEGFSITKRYPERAPKGCPATFIVDSNATLLVLRSTPPT